MFGTLDVISTKNRTSEEAVAAWCSGEPFLNEAGKVVVTRFSPLCAKAEVIRSCQPGVVTRAWGEPESTLEWVVIATVDQRPADRAT